MSKTLTQLCEEYNDWCGKNDIDSFLKTQGYGDRRMLSADELLHELMNALEDIEAGRKVLVSRVAWVKQFCLEWEKTAREENEAQIPHAVMAKHLQFGWTNVHVFPHLNGAREYVRGQLDERLPPTYQTHVEYISNDVVFVISPIVEG